MEEEQLASLFITMPWLKIPDMAGDTHFTCWRLLDKGDLPLQSIAQRSVSKHSAAACAGWELLVSWGMVSSQNCLLFSCNLLHSTSALVLYYFPLLWKPSQTSNSIEDEVTVLCICAPHSVFIWIQMYESALGVNHEEQAGLPFPWQAAEAICWGPVPGWDEQSTRTMWVQPILIQLWLLEEDGVLGCSPWMSLGTLQYGHVQSAMDCWNA